MSWLAVTPQRYPDESMQGYRCRVAADNGFADWPSFVRAFLPVDKHTTSNLLLTGTQSLLGVELAFNTPTNDIFRLHFARRVCPLCLMQAEYMRSAWHISLAPYCLEHRYLLIDHCPECGKSLDNHCATIANCRCGFDLRFVEKSYESKTVPDLAWLIAARVSVAPLPILNSVWPVQHLSARGLERLTLLLGSYATFSNITKPRKVATRSDVRNALAIVDAAQKIIGNWPTSFYELLDGMRDENDHHIQSYLGHIYRAIYHELIEPEFDFLRKAMDDYVALHWDGLITCKNTWQSSYLRSDPPYFSSAKLRKETHIGRGRYKQWITTGKLNGKIRETLHGRHLILIAAGQRETIEQLSQCRTLKQAAEELGLPELRVRELLDDGLLQGIHPSRSAPWEISPESIEYLRCQLSTAAAQPVSINDSFSLDTILRHRMDESLTFAEFFRALINGLIPFSIESEIKLKNIHIDKRAFDAWCATQSHGVSVPELSKRLGIKQEVAYHLVNKHIIASTSTGRLGCRISNSAINDFKQTYCLARDLAREWHTTSKSVIARLKRENIFAVAGKDIDGCRQYVYRYSEVQRVKNLIN